MKTEINLELLTEKSVTLMTTKIFEDCGEEFRAPPHAKAYLNSTRGRAELKEELPEPFLSAVLAVWGKKPTIQEEVEQDEL